MRKWPAILGACAFVLAFALSVNAQTKEKVAPSAQRTVGYEDLEKQVGEKVVIHTVNKTTRSGTLVRYTNVALTLRVDNGGYELSIRRGDVREIALVIPAADPLFPTKTPLEADPGAKKN